MIRYKAGYKYVATGVHAQVLDFPAAISWATDLEQARQMLTFPFTPGSSMRRLRVNR